MHTYLLICQLVNPLTPNTANGYVLLCKGNAWQRKSKVKAKYFRDV